MIMCIAEHSSLIIASATPTQAVCHWAHPLFQYHSSNILNIFNIFNIFKKWRKHARKCCTRRGVAKLKDIPRITASPRRPAGGGAMP
jgi:hypothetical protein